MARLFTLLIALLLVTPRAFAADELSDDDYVTRNFGTVAVLHTAKQVVDPNVGWWGEKTAPGLNNPGYLMGIVNSRRLDKKITPLLDPNDTSAITLEEEKPEGSGFRYEVSFGGMRPSEVKALVELLGGPTKLLPGTTSVTYEPLTHRWISASSYDGSNIVITLASQRIEVPYTVGFDELSGKVDAALKQVFGKSVPFEVTLTRSSYIAGGGGTDVSVHIDLNPPPPGAPSHGPEGD